jgi:hypothetical protein
MMARKRNTDEPSYGKIMTSLLIPKDMRTNPRRILSGIAFIAVVVVFLFAALSRGCQRDLPPEPSRSATAACERIG